MASDKTVRPTRIPNVVYFGVQIVLIGGLMLLAALVLLEIWQSAKCLLPVLRPLVICHPARLMSMAVRPSAGLFDSAPSRAPPSPVRWGVRSGPIDMVFREDPLSDQV